MYRKIVDLRIVFCFIFSHPLVAEQTTNTFSPQTTQRLEINQFNRQFFTEELGVSKERLRQKTVKPNDIEQPKVTITTTACPNGSFRLQFTFPEEVTVREEKDYCLYLEFNQSIDSLDLLNAQEALGYLINRFANGYHTLILEPKRPVFYYTQAIGNVFILDIVPNYEASSIASRSLEIARARLLIEEREYIEAFAAIGRLLTLYPCNQEVLVLLASLEGLVPRWQRQVQILQSLHYSYPCDHDVQAMLHDAFFPHTSFLRAERQLQRTVDLAAAQLYQMEAELIIKANFCRYLYIGGFYLAETGHIKDVINEEGLTEGFLGVRQQGRLYLRNEDVDGDAYTGLVYAAEGGVYGIGGQAKWLWPKLQGTFSVMADWNRPYWEIFETLAHFGREDRLKFRIDSVANRYVYWNFEGGSHRVGIHDVPNGFTSLIAGGDFFVNWIISNPIIAFNYTLDAEYVVQKKFKRGIDGNLYRPVPLDSRELHYLRMYLYYQWHEFWFFSVNGGAAFNRLGTNDVVGGVSIKYIKPCPCGLEIELAADRYPSQTVNGATIEYLTAKFTAHF